MLSLKLIRDEPDRVRAALASRNDRSSIDEILGADAKRRALQTEADELRHRRNAVSEQISKMKQRPPELIQEMRDVGARIKELDSQIGELEQQVNRLVLYLPNIPDLSVPVAPDESGNVETARWRTPRAFSFRPRPHWEIGELVGGFDFARGAKIAGARSWVLRGDVARLNRALIDWMLDLHVGEHGYTEIATPYLVKSECMVGTSQLPKFAEDAYKVEQDDLYLIPTAEVPVTNLHRDEIIPPGTLPLNYVAYSACFRREAGAAGRDTRGIIRVHQFEKVEMVKIVAPETTDAELERLLENALDVLRLLEIPYRVMLKCTGDLGFSAAKTYDPEAWFPGQDRYIEISSCSQFGDFQSRRMNMRYRPGPDQPPAFPTTLNGSGLAVGRTLAAVLENYQQEDGSVAVPNVLRPYMRGQATIPVASSS